MAIAKINPSGTKVSVGVLVEPELFKRFDAVIKSKCLQKTSVLRRLITDFVETERFITEQS